MLNCHNFIIQKIPVFSFYLLHNFIFKKIRTLFHIIRTSTKHCTVLCFGLYRTLGNVACLLRFVLQAFSIVLVTLDSFLMLLNMSDRTAFQCILISPTRKFFERTHRRSSTKISHPVVRSCVSASSRETNCSSGTNLKKPYGYWKKTSNILRELRTYLASNECLDKSTMPTRTQLIQAGRHDLAGAISRAGWVVTAEAANLPLSSIARPRSLNLIFATRLHLTTGRMRPYMYWRDFNHVREELLQTMRQLNINYLPSAKCLVHAGRSDLARAISIHGGWRAVADRMAVNCASDEFLSKRDETLFILLREYVAEQLKRNARSARQTSRTMPTNKGQRTSRKEGILYDIQLQFGGLKNVKEYANSVDTSPCVLEEKSHQLKDIIRSHFLECVRTTCNQNPNRESGLMLRKSELTALGRNDLMELVKKLGRSRVARLCGLRVRRFQKSQVAE